MKIKSLFFFLLSLLLFPMDMRAQLTSTYGYQLSVADTVRILLVFAELDCNDNCTNADSISNCAADNVYWLPHQLPPDAASWLDPAILPGQQPTKYITKYYSDASFGHYIVLGDYIPYVVTIPRTEANGINRGMDAVIDSLNAKPSAIITANGLTPR